MDLDRKQAIENMKLYLDLLTVLYLEKNFISRRRLDNVEHDYLLSPDTLPRLLTESVGSMTVLDFLCKKNEDNLKSVIQDAEQLLSPLVDLFLEFQISEANERLSRLRFMLEFEFHE